MQGDTSARPSQAGQTEPSLVCLRSDPAQQGALSRGGDAYRPIARSCEYRGGRLRGSAERPAPHSHSGLVKVDLPLLALLHKPLPSASRPAWAAVSLCATSYQLAKT